MFMVTMVEFEDGALNVDVAIVAEGLGIAPPLVLEGMREGRITSLCERGVDDDDGRYRLTFFSERRRFRVVVDRLGNVVQHSSIDFGDRGRPAPSSKQVS
jgi:hypothetical protein